MNLARFRRAKSWISRPFQHNEALVDQTEEAVEGQPQLGNTEGEEEPGNPSGHEDPLVMDRPVASSSRTPTYEQPYPLAEDPQEQLSQLPNPSHTALPEDLPALAAPLPSNIDPAPSQRSFRYSPLLIPILMIVVFF